MCCMDKVSCSTLLPYADCAASKAALDVLHTHPLSLLRVLIAADPAGANLRLRRVLNKLLDTQPQHISVGECMQQGF